MNQQATSIDSHRVCRLCQTRPVDIRVRLVTEAMTEAGQEALKLLADAPSSAIQSRICALCFARDLGRLSGV